MRVPTILISGFLGSGKTTLVSRTLDSIFKDKRVALIENEIGSFSIDSKTIITKNVMIKEITKGCLCCNLSNDFSLAVDDIINITKPDILLIETTGVANPLPVIFMISAENRLVIQTIITVVDPLNISNQIEENLASHYQILSADVIFISKVDIATHAEVERATKIVRNINRRSIIIQTYNSLLNALLSPNVQTHHRDTSLSHSNDNKQLHLLADNIQTFSIELDQSVNFNKIEIFLSNLDSTIYRVKGFLVVNGKLALLDYVSGRFTLSFSCINTEKQILVFIGKNITKLRETVSEKLLACV